MKRTLNLVRNDSWLEPYAETIAGRHRLALAKEAEITGGGKRTLPKKASRHL